MNIRAFFIWGTLIALAAGAIIVSTRIAQSEPAQISPPIQATKQLPKISIATDHWPGYAGVHFAKKLGYCNEEGVECTTIATDDIESIIEGLKTGKYEIATGLSTAYLDIINDDPDQHFRIIAASDQSLGSDGIVARVGAPPLANNPNPHFASSLLYQFLIGEVVKRGGGDITSVSFATSSLEEDDALALLRSKKADYHATYEPFLSKARAEGMRIEYTSANDPGIITDVIVVNDNAISLKRSAVAGFVRAYFRAQKYIEEHPEEAYAELARDYGMSTEAMLDQVKYINLLSASDNMRVMQLAPGYQSLPNILRAATLTRAKRDAKVTRDPESLIDKSFVEGVRE